MTLILIATKVNSNTKVAKRRRKKTNRTRKVNLTRRAKRRVSISLRAKTNQMEKTSPKLHLKSRALISKFTIRCRKVKGTCLLKFLKCIERKRRNLWSRKVKVIFMNICRSLSMRLSLISMVSSELTIQEKFISKFSLLSWLYTIVSEFHWRSVWHQSLWRVNHSPF